VVVTLHILGDVYPPLRTPQWVQGASGGSPHDDTVGYDTSLAQTCPSMSVTPCEDLLPMSLTETLCTPLFQTSTFQCDSPSPYPQSATPGAMTVTEMVT